MQIASKQSNRTSQRNSHQSATTTVEHFVDFHQKSVLCILGQNGPWQNFMHIYVYEDDEEQGGGALSKPGQWPQ